jgi:signal transduction histidine kinase
LIRGTLPPMKGTGRMHAPWLACLFVPAMGCAAEEGWDQRLANALSPSLRKITHQQADIPSQLSRLPSVPIDDQGGTGGFASIHPSAVAAKGSRHAVEIRWDVESAVDLVALVPARRYDARGLDAHFGMPDDFTVELLDHGGKIVALVARENNTLNDRVRRGHPFVYQISPPVKAAGMRITADRLRPDANESDGHVHAWSEVFVFAGDRNVAHHAEVTAIGGSQPQSPWHWKPEFMVDGQNPLGLPEVPAQNRNIGWISNGRKMANEPVSLNADLGGIKRLDALRLIPARKPTPDLPSGFGFPRKFSVSVSAADTPGGAGTWTPVAETEMKNPGHNAVTVSFPPTEARWVRISATELWKEFDSYPAFFAMSEVEVLDGSVNLAKGKPIRSSDGMLNIIGPGGNYWSGASLTDGFGPDGKLVPTRDWLRLLDERLLVERRQHDLQVEAAQLVKRWRGRALAASILLGLAGAFSLIALPIRYRLHSRRELEKVRDRIAGDLHDEVGSNLGSIQMFADLAEGRSGPSDELKRIQRIAAETVSAVRDIVWLLRPGGNHRIGAVEHLRETSSIMLETLQWEFHANEESWKIELPEETNRHLFLYFREALHNILRHAKADHVEVTVKTSHDCFLLTVKDDGVGIAPEKFERPATLRALRQRAHSLGARLQVDSKPGEGTTLGLTIPADRKRNSRKPAPSGLRSPD